MKVLDLACAHGHRFEGWFASEEEFRDQSARGLLECPVCGDQAIEKQLSAPYVQTRRAEPPEEPRSTAPQVAPAERSAPLSPEQQAQVLRALRAWVQDSEDVGERFAAEARAIHHGEAEARSIRGVATPGEAAALLEEGVPVLPLPDLPLLKGPLQ
ncbi:DUF1178 family protein [Tepidimonas sp.]|uniref:DUF1178 family protein n=1 Tax=Tepidimonas sp. TaxID=2002775 RepID=UPI00391A8928